MCTDLQALIDGHALTSTEPRTRGWKAIASKASKNDFDRRLTPAFQRLLRCVFSGEHLSPGQPFLGDLVWEKGQDGKVKLKPLDYDGKADEVRDLLMWIFQCSKQYEATPEIREVFKK
jgi:hypothetical protein